MLIEHDGQKFEFLNAENMTPGEVAAVERVSGLRQAQIRAMAQVCGCGHRLNAHPVIDEDDLSKGRVCALCGCDDPAEDLPMDVNTAFMWVSLKRVRPELKFSDVQNIPLSEYEAIEDEPDPSTGGQPLEPTVEDDTSTSPVTADSSTSGSSLTS